LVPVFNGPIYKAKMADEESQRAECVFKTLVDITEKSGKLRKDLRNDILESVSKYQ